jgi:hypothetical protein
MIYACFVWKFTADNQSFGFAAPEKHGSPHDLQLSKAQIRHCHVAFKISFVYNLIKTICNYKAELIQNCEK